MSYFLTRTRTQTEYQYFEKLKLALILFSIFEKTRNFSNIRKWGIFLTRTRTRFIFKFQKNSKLTLTYKNEEINWLKLFLTRVFWEKNNSNSRKKIPRVRKKNSHFFEKSAFSDFNSLVCFLHSTQPILGLCAVVSGTEYSSVLYIREINVYLIREKFPYVRTNLTIFKGKLDIFCLTKANFNS